MDGSVTTTVTIKMDFGIKINKLDDLKNLEKYKYIYFGNEFCEKKNPSFYFCERIVNYCNEHNKIPVLLTPYLTQKYLIKLKELISKIYLIKKEFEITINDFGLIEFLKSMPEIKVNLGRLQIKMKKGPEIMSNVLNENIETFKVNSLNNPGFIRFMKKENINRFEMDIPPQGLLLPNNKKITLYVGNAVITTTRRCPFIDSMEENYNLCIKDCKKECLNFYVVKNTKFYDDLIYVLGNTEFIKTSNTLSMDLKDKFDRILIFKKIEDLL